MRVTGVWYLSEPFALLVSASFFFWMLVEQVVEGHAPELQLKHVVVERRKHVSFFFLGHLGSIFFELRIQDARVA